jgi:hypothetical protein
MAELTGLIASLSATPQNLDPTPTDQAIWRCNSSLCAQEEPNYEGFLVQRC